jgi:hypothetical protein
VNKTFSGKSHPFSLLGHKLSLHGVNMGSVQGLLPLYISCLLNIFDGFPAVATDIIFASVLSAFFI